jgi:hypothetical protein
MWRLAAVGAVVLAACYPGGAETLTDFDSVTTQHDPAANFAVLQTYALPDSVMELPVSSTPVLDHSNDAEIVARVAAHLDALGWTRVDPSTSAADVDVVVYASLGPSLLYVSYPFYDGFPGWPGFAGYDSTWGVFYPWARPGQHVLIDGGSVRIDMLDARNPDTANRLLRALWSVAVNGLPAGNTSNLQRIDQGIDQAFAQSQYL